MTMRLSIVGNSVCIPRTLITNGELEERFGLEKGFIKEHTGIETRSSFNEISLKEIYPKVAVDAVKTSGLEKIESLVIAKDFYERDISGVYEAIKTSLYSEGIELSEKDPIILSNCSAGASAIGKAAKSEKNSCLIVAVSKLQDLVNSEDIGSSILWGDGAAAIVLDKLNGDSMLVYHNEEKSPSLQALNILKDSSDRFYCKMDGHSVIRYVLKTIPSLIEKGLNETGLTAKDISCFIFHQANGKILDTLAKHLKIDEGKILKNAPYYGNTGVASPFITYDQALKSKKIREGDYFAFVTFGAEECGKGMQSDIAIFRKGSTSKL
jgi:3-oxoacyl-[acyl-carrier-protein] synthase III